MADDPMPTIDPRYDRAFQRAAALEPKAEPPWGSAATPAPTTATPSGRPVHQDPDPAPDDLDAAFDELEDLEPVEPRPAPRWELAILLVGIGLIVISIGLTVGNSFVNYGIMSDGGGMAIFAMVQVIYYFPQPMFFIGLASLVGLLFLRAARAGRSR